MGCCHSQQPKKMFMSDHLLFLEKKLNPKQDPGSDFYKNKKAIESLREELGDKANYYAVTERMKATARSMDTSETSEEMGWYLMALLEAVGCMSMEIYEHYRAAADLLKELIKGYVCSEGFDVEELIWNHSRFAVMLGTVIVGACECGCLNAEKYEHIGRQLVDGKIEET